MSIETNLATHDDLSQAQSLIGNFLQSDASNDIPKQLRLDLVGAQSMLSRAKSRIASDIQAERVKRKQDTKIMYPKD